MTYLHLEKYSIERGIKIVHALMCLRFMNVWEMIREKEGHTVSRWNIELVNNLKGERRKENSKAFGGRRREHSDGSSKSTITIWKVVKSTEKVLVSPREWRPVKSRGKARSFTSELLVKVRDIFWCRLYIGNKNNSSQLPV